MAHIIGGKPVLRRVLWQGTISGAEGEEALV